MALTELQIKLLYQASQTKMLSDEQRANLSASNPYGHRSRTAEILQRELARIAPLEARLMAQEAGAELSLAAAAASIGAGPSSPQIEDEINRIRPQTESEVRKARIAELTKTNPWGEPDTFSPEGLRIPGAPPNLTAALALHDLDPQLADQLKAQRVKAEPADNLTDRERYYVQQLGR